MTTAPRARLLVIDDEPDLRTLYELTLLREGYDVDSAGTVEEAWALLQTPGAGAYQLVITDMRLPDGTGLDLLRRLESNGRSEKAVVITAYGSPENAVEALKAGAYDYLTKPVDLRQFRAVVASAVGRLPASAPLASGLGPAPMSSNRHNVQLGAVQPQVAALARIVGNSPAIQQVRSLVSKVARSMAPVLVHGESGTGKELVARAIHDCSPRARGPFVAVNCGAIPELLLEAEFFGSKKGAFTGALEDREGFFQASQGGTLFLDEIGDLPLAMQSKLLRVIQERVVRPLGGTHETPTNVRLVSATHRDLGQEVQGGRFRQDLYYRLNVIRLPVPALRERLVDLEPICQTILARIATDAGVVPVPVLSADALAQLHHYRFPGNVRELENLLHRALALATGPDIGVEELGLTPEWLQDSGFDSGFSAFGGLPGQGRGAGQQAAYGPGTAGALPTRSVDVPLELSDTAPSPSPHTASAAASASPMSARSVLNSALNSAPDSAPVSAPESVPPVLPSDLAAYLDQVERDVLERALDRHRYNRTAAGASLGLSLRQMRYRMARLGVGAPEADTDRSESA